MASQTINQADTNGTNTASGRRPRLEDVASLAGVSLGAASKALAWPEKVRISTRQKVSAAAAQLGYIPHGAARALASRRSRLIGLLLPTMSNPIYADFSQALQKSLRDEGYLLLVSAHEYDLCLEEQILDQLLQTGIDGLVLVGDYQHHFLRPKIESAGIPLLCTWSVDEVSSLANVGLNNRRAMQSVVDYLVGLGHQEFAVIAGDSYQNERTRNRLQGVKDALMARGLMLPEEWIFRGGFAIDCGKRAMRQLLLNSALPSAIICTTDLLAIGAIDEACKHGYSVPGDFSITGFDDVEFATTLNPPLTTVHVAADEIGQRSAENIIAMLANPEVAVNSPVCSIEIATRLMIRSSCGPAVNKR